MVGVGCWDEQGAVEGGICELLSYESKGGRS